MSIKVLLITLFFITGTTYAQKAPEAYWVVETNRNAPAYSIIRLYLADHSLYHEQRLNSAIDTRSKKNIRLLNKMVDHYYKQKKLSISGLAKAGTISSQRNVLCECKTPVTKSCSRPKIEISNNIYAPLKHDQTLTSR